MIIDLHAAPGSQNGYEHSSSRDGSIEWGKTDDTLKKTVAVIQFLTERCKSNLQDINVIICYINTQLQDSKFEP